MSKTFIIAEAGVNHNGSITLAKELIAVASESGADAVKFQSFKADRLTTHTAPKARYQLTGSTDQESQYTMLKKLELLDEHYPILADYAKEKNIIFLSSPFDILSLEYLVSILDLPIIKIPSGEITNGPLLLKAAQTQKKLILSTGASTLSDIEFALSVLAYGYLNHANSPTYYDLKKSLNSLAAQAKMHELITLLHCTTQYPAAFSEINLQAMTTLRHSFQLSVGYSDHSLGIEVAIAAVTLGATMIEKHFTLDKNMTGPDHQASLNPEELAAMIKAIRHIEIALGHGKKIPAISEYQNQAIVRKSLVALRDIHVGEIFTEENLGLKRPGNGISGIYYWDWLGKTATCNYSENEIITE